MKTGFTTLLALVTLGLLPLACSDNGDGGDDGTGGAGTGGRTGGAAGELTSGGSGGGGATGGAAAAGAAGQAATGGSSGSAAGGAAMGGAAGSAAGGAAGSAAGGAAGSAAGGSMTGGTAGSGATAGGAGGAGSYSGPAENLACTLRGEDFTPDHSTPVIVYCPAGCAADPGPVWGTDVYTSDSALCPALIHGGVLPATGGYALLTFTDGLYAYRSSTRHGITSSPYGSWHESFYGLPVDANGDAIGTPPDTDPTLARVDCVHTGDTLDAAGADVAVECPAGCEARAIWGTDVYTSDSSLCTAAVHMGLISFASGGEFVYTAGGAQASFEGSTRNGVTSNAYGAFGYSFTLSPR